MRSVCRLALIAACSAWPLAAIGSGDDVELRGSVHAGDRPVPHAAVWLTASSRPGTVQPRKVVLDQRNLTFTPRILIVQVGATVELPNNDRVFHNVFSFRDGKRFDLGLYPVGAVRRVTFDRPGVSRIFCNIHPNMAAYVVAVDTPYHAVADEEGRFSIPSVIRGTYTYHAWRPGAEELTGSAAVDEQRSLDIRWP
jgi:plastocyanin